MFNLLWTRGRTPRGCRQERYQKKELIIRKGTEKNMSKLKKPIPVLCDGYLQDAGVLVKKPELYSPGRGAVQTQGMGKLSPLL